MLNHTDRKFLIRKYLREGLNMNEIEKRFNDLNNLKYNKFKVKKEFKTEFSKLWDSGI